MPLLEAEIELYLSERPELLLPHLGDELGEIKVQRQVRLPIGGAIVDVLIAHKHGVTVVELKRDIIDDAAVAQTLRYMGALNQMSMSESWLSPFDRIDGIVAAPRISESALWALRGVNSGKRHSRLHYLRVETHLEVSWDMEDFVPGCS